MTEGETHEAQGELSRHRVSGTHAPLGLLLVVVLTGMDEQNTLSRGRNHVPENLVAVLTLKPQNVTLLRNRVIANTIG